MPQHTNPFIGAFHGVAWALRRIVTRKTLRASNRLAVWPLGAPKGAEPSLVFEIDENPGPPEGDGAAVGDFVINGTLCIVADDGRTFWPTYNPEPSRRGVALR